MTSAHTRLFLVPGQTTPANMTLSFTNPTAVANYYGVSSPQASLALDYFSGPNADDATMLFQREGLGQRPHLLGANIDGLTLAQLQAVNGSLSLDFDGYQYTGNVDLSGVSNFAEAASDVRIALNSNRPVIATTTGTTITPETCQFTGYVNGAQVFIESIQSGTPELGGFISGPGIISGSNNLIDQHKGTINGPGYYTTFGNSGTAYSWADPGPLTETYGILTTGTVTSGTVAVGQAVDGPGILTNTAIDQQLSPNTYIVDNAQTFSGNTKMLPASLMVSNQFRVGDTENNDYFDIDPNGDYGFDNNRSNLSYASGSAAALLGLTQVSGAHDSTPGGLHPTVAHFMDNIVNKEGAQFSSVQANIDGGEQALVQAWTQSNPGYTYITGSAWHTSPAG